MKKRFLSLLLLVAMVITMVPVMSSAAGAAESSTETYVDYKDLYVTDGLAGLFTAYGDDTSVDVTNGTWTNRVEGGTNATFGGGTWSRGTYGGVGFDIIFGTVTLNEAGTEYGYAQHSSYNNYWSEWELDFDMSLLPDEDYTVEYVALYGPQYVIRASDNAKVDGRQGVDDNGIAYGVTNMYANNHTHLPVDLLGFLSSHTTDRGCSFYGTYGGLFWKVNPTKPTSWEGSINGWGDNFQSHNRYDRQIHTYAITRDETTTETTDETTSETTTVVSAVYAHSFDGATSKTLSLSTANTTAGSIYYDAEETAGFYLSNRLTTDFYSVRVYNKVLTADEQAQNHMADILGFYDIKAPKLTNVVDALVASVSSFASFSFASDASAYEANKAEIQAFVDTIANSDEHLVYSLYVQDGLTGLFTAFNTSDTTANLTTDVWTNRVYGGANATFYHTSTNNGNNAWVRNADGSVGYDLVLGTFTDNGDGTYGYALHNALNTYNSEVVLKLGLDLLPKEDFTIEYVALYGPTYSYLGSNLVETWGNDASGNPYYVSANIESANRFYYALHDHPDMIGFLTSYAEYRGGYSTAFGTALGTIGWKVVDAEHNTTWNGWNGWGPNMFDTTRGDRLIHTYSITRDETTTTTDAVIDSETGEETTPATTTITALYTHLLDGASVSSRQYSTAGDSSSGVATYYPDYEDDTDFYLSKKLTTDFYGLRIYDRLLTAAEKNQNHFVDIVLYYDLAISADFIADSALLQNAIDEFATESFLLDATEKAAKKVELQKVLDAGAPEFGGYEDLYVKNGLTALFTAFTGDTYVDLTTGTWTNRVNSEKNATLGNASYWTTGANGGVGVTMLYGTYIDGVFTETADTNNFNVLGTRLEFGIDLLPVVDYTVEYVAQYNNVMAVDANGNPVEKLINITDAVWPNNAALSNQTVATTAIDQLGNLGSYANSGRDKAFATGSEGYYGGLGSVAFKHNANRAANGWNSGTGSAGLFKASEIWQTRGSINTFEISRDATGYTNNVITLTRNGAVYSTKTFTESIADEHTGGNDYFYLGERLSVDYYAVRIYNRILTSAEKQQNHFVDLVLFYDLTVPEDTLSDAAKMQTLYTDFATQSMVADATEYAAKKAELQNVITPKLEFGDAADIYVKDGLKSLFTAYDSSYINLTPAEGSGTWTDRVSGGTATLGNPDRWTVGANGGVGFNVFAGELLADGTTSSTSTYDTWKDSYTFLNLGINRLPTADYSIEYVAMYKPVYMADATTGEVATINGVPLETYDYYPSATAGAVDYRTDKAPVDALGVFTSFVYATDGAFKDWGHIRGALVWVYNAPNWSSGNKGQWIGSANPWSGNGGLNKTTEVYQTNNAIRTYMISLDETNTGDAVTALFSLYRDGVLYNSNVGALNSTANTGRTGYDDTVGAGGNFYLSAGRPVDFYAVRVYNRVLTSAEQAQNKLADIVLYYGIELDDAFLPGGEYFDDLASALSGVTFETDEIARAGVALTIQAAIEDIQKNSKIVDLYVQDNLVALYTALSANDASASVANGTWANRVSGGAAAIFGNTQYWVRNADGSVGVTQLWGSYIDGTFSADSEYNTADVLGTRLDIGIDQLPVEDYTVEYVAKYGNIMAVDINGEPVEALVNITDATWPSNTASTNAAAGLKYNPIDSLGNLFNLTAEGRDKPFASNYVSSFGGNGSTAWRYTTARRGNNWNIESAYTEQATLPYVPSNIWHKRGTVNTYEISRDVTFADDVYTNVLSIARDRAPYASLTTTAVPNTDEHTGDNDYFYLAERLSVSFYAVRVYSDLLTTAEKLRNHAVDITYYYGLTLPEAAYTDMEVLARVSAVLIDAEIVSDATEKAANKAAYQKLVDAIVVEQEEEVTSYDYDSLYVQDGLLGLYTAFAGDTSVSVLDGVWANKIDNEYGAATLRGTVFWQRYTVGIGYTMDLDTWKASGTSVGIDLPAEFENLDSFTVETFTTAKGVTTEDGTRYIYTAAESQYGHWKNYASSFRFGMLNAVMFVTVNEGFDDHGSFGARWYVSQAAYQGSEWYLTTDGWGGTKLYADDSETDYSDQGFREMGSRYVPGTGVMQVSKVTDASTDDVTYAIAYDNADPYMQKTIASADYDTYLAGNKGSEAAGRFSLFTALPADVYAIRVYNRELTAMEKLQNNFVDKAGLYRIDITGFADFTDEKKLEVYNLFANVGTDLDPAAAQAIYDLNVNGGTDKAGESILSFNKYLPILNGASGYRVLFAVSEDAVAMLEASGYTVSYGAIVAPAASNDIADLVIDSASASAITTSATAGQLVIVGGSLGSEIFYNFTDTGAGKVSFSVAVTSSDAAYYGSDVLVRGFVVVTDSEGNNAYYYDEAYENEVLDGSVSILNAADYFVNAYEGNVATTYSYMNSAALRAILQSAGRDVYREIADDLVLYVDVNGDDANTGLSADEPLATLGAAYEATVAHLGQTGLKSVTINLSAGTHFIEEAFVLNGADILADSYFVKVIGAGEDTVISSAKAIDLSNYAVYDENYGIYSVELPKVDGAYPNFRNLVGYYEGERYPLAMAQSGDTESNFTISAIQFTDGTDIYAADGSTTDTDGDVLAPDWLLSEDTAAKTTSAILTLPASAFVSGVNYAGTELHFTAQWSFNIMHIEKVEISGSNALVYIDYDEFKNYANNPGHNVAGESLWMKNGLGLLYDGNDDAFAYDQTSGRLYYKAASMPLEYLTSVRYASLENLFVLNDVANVTISDVTLTGYSMQQILPGTGHGFGQSASGTNGTFSKAAGIVANGIDGLTVKNVKFFDADAAGVVAYGTVVKNVTVDSSRFENLGDGAIRIGEVGRNVSTASSYIKNVTLTNNYINETGNTFNSSTAITVTTAANLLIAHNTITNVPYSGISVGWRWEPNGQTIDAVRSGMYHLYNVEIAYNYIADFMLSSRDGGAIYTLGGALPKDDPSTPNYVHHNYVNVTAGTGNHRGDTGFFAVFYHDGGSSNWHTYSNVLMNSKGSSGTVPGAFGLFFTQYNPGNDSYNINLEGNYTIGVSSAAAFDRDSYTFDREANNVQTSHYAFASVANLNANTSVVDTYEGINLVEAPSDSATTVYSIYAAAGASYGADTKAHGGLTVTAAAIEDEIRLNEEFVDSSIGNTLPYTVTFTTGTETVTTKVTAGAVIGVPGEFSAEGTTYTYAIDGETIDPATYVMPAKDITVDVTVTVAAYTATITDGLVKVTHTLKAGEAIPAPTEFTKTGYDTTYTYDGAVVDFATFTMPAEDITIQARYSEKIFSVTFTDGETTLVKKAAYGSTVSVPASFAKTGHTTKAMIGDLDVTYGYTMAAEDVTVTISYTAKTYDVVFNYVDADGMDASVTISVVFGEVIEIPAGVNTSFEDEDWVYNLSEWTGYTEGMILETEGAEFTAKYEDVVAKIAITFVNGMGDAQTTTTVKYAPGAVIELPEAIAVEGYTFTGWDGYTEGMTATADVTITATYTADSAYALGDINGDSYIDAGDITLLVAVFNNTLEDASVVKGETDLNNDGYVDAGDITYLVALFTGDITA